MGDILGNAVSGLLSFQRALSTTSHNIANVNTEGYSRQRVELDTRNPSLVGGRFIGSGVEITSIERSYDQFITNNLRESTSSFYRLDKFTELSSQIDDILADPQGGISPILQEFFSAVQDVADDPSSGSARLQLINVGESLVNRFNAFDTRLQSLKDNTETDIETQVNEINQLAASIADINQTLEEINSGGELSQQSSDLLDQRDALLQELSQHISIQVINEPNNLITVQIGNGQTMVTGTTAFGLSVQPATGDPSRNIIVYNGFATVNDLSGQLKGGELGGLLDYRDTVLEPAVNSLGRLAIGLADSFNDQHREGMDLLDNLGGNFFGFNQPRTTPFTSNSGTSTVTTTVFDVSQLTINDYTLNYDGTNWTLVSDAGTSSTPADVLADTPNLGDTTIRFEGLEVVIDAASVPVSGDRFTIRPTIEGARTIDVLISDPNQIAAAAPIRGISSLNNLGDLAISPGEVVDAANPQLLDSVTFAFDNPPTTFTATADVVVGGSTFLAGASIPYSNNMQVEANGWRVNLTGLSPQAGDVLSVEANFGGNGDNRNALDLAGLQTTGLLDNGVNNYQEDYSVLVGRIGAQTHSASVDREAQLSLLTQAEERRSQVAGVNLDEEAADLIKYQQAYEAAARMISTAQTLFETLINAAR